LVKLVWFPLLSGLFVLTACGEPLTVSEAGSKYSGYTVSKLTSEQRYKSLGPNDPSLGTRYIYHATDGRAYYFKETPKGYRRRESGRWWVGDDKICYSMRVTSAEDVEGGQCAPAGTDAVWSSFERGDTRNLAPRRPAAGNSRNQKGVDCTFNISCAIKNTPNGEMAAAVVLGVGVLFGQGMANAAAEGGYADTGPNSSGDTKPSKSNPTTTTASSSGYRIFETTQYSSGQTVVARGKCNNGRSFNVRYYPENGGGSRSYSIYSLFGSSVDNVATKFCS
jgi:hypothetical protein